MRAPGIELAQVAENAAGDADRGGRQRGAEEQIGIGVTRPGSSHGPTTKAPSDEGHDDAECADGEGARTDLDQVGQPRFKADLQQQHDDAELGDEGDDRVLGDGVKKPDTEQREIAEHDAEQQFTEHRRESRAFVPAVQTGGRSSG
jgi:hypothetical protein